MMDKTTYSSPIGTLYLGAEENRLCIVSFFDFAGIEKENDILKHCKRQLEEYFFQQRKSFSLDIKIVGSAFEQKVYFALLNIPYGQTMTYQKLAQQIGHPKAARAVGNALQKNPLCIVVPCHRIVGKAVHSGGFCGKQKIKEKEYLLDLEKKNNL